jgi:hypothetical protein
MQRTVDQREAKSLARDLMEHDERVLGLVLSTPLRLLALQLAFEGLPNRPLEAPDMSSESEGHADADNDWDPMAEEWDRTLVGFEARANPFELLSHLDACGALESILEAERCDAVEKCTQDTLGRASRLFDALVENERTEEFADALNDPEVFGTLLREFDIA